MIEIHSRSYMDALGNVGMICECTDDTSEERVARRLSMENYLEFLGKRMKRKVSLLPIPKLPKGYYAGTIGENETYKVILYEPPRKRPVYHDSGHYLIPFPGLLFKFYVTNGKYKEGHVFAVKGEPTAASKLYKYPLGNVSETGNICFGNISLKESSITNSPMLIEAFFSGKTNNDYFTPGEKVSVRYSQGKLLEILSKREAFPEKWLIKDGRTVEFLQKNLI